MRPPSASAAGGGRFHKWLPIFVVSRALPDLPRLCSFRNLEALKLPSCFQMKVTDSAWYANKTHRLVLALIDFKLIASAHAVFSTAGLAVGARFCEDKNVTDCGIRDYSH